MANYIPLPVVVAGAAVVQVEVQVVDHHHVWPSLEVSTHCPLFRITCTFLVLPGSCLQPSSRFCPFFGML